MGQRKRYTSEEKVRILRELLEDGKPVSQVAESHGVTPESDSELAETVVRGSGEDLRGKAA
jgi:hypothetical protein